MPGKGKANWAGLADRLDKLSDDLLAAAAEAPDEIETQIIELQAHSLKHTSLHLRMYEE